MEKLLSNPFYHGLIRIERTGEEYPGIHEPIISKRLFDKVQQVRRYRGGPKGTQHQDLFVGLFRCHLCNAPLVPERQKGRVYYRCQKKSCPMTCIREDRLEAAIRAKLASLQLKPGVKQQLIEDWEKGTVLQQLIKLRRSLAAKIEEREAKKGRLAELLVEEAIDVQTHKMKREEYDFELQQLRQELADLPEPSELKAERERRIEHMAELLLVYESADRTGKRELLRDTFATRTASQTEVFVELMSWAVLHLDVEQLSGEKVSHV
ncbi:MAG: recombinase zinc beta ribbon domain-containing protein [Pseudomonadota bacterium]